MKQLTAVLVCVLTVLSATTTTNIVAIAEDAPEIDDARESIPSEVVLIRTSKGNGSGVIIARQGTFYTVVTAAHVLKQSGSVAVDLVTGDGEHYLIGAKRVQFLKGLDLAIFTFSSLKDYPVAKIGDLPFRGDVVRIRGFSTSLLEETKGQILAASQSYQEGGYGLVLGNTLVSPGMSGGAIYNKAGELVAITNVGIGNSYLFDGVSGLGIPVSLFLRVNNDVASFYNQSGQMPVISLQTADDYFVSGQIKQLEKKHGASVLDFDRALLIEPNFPAVYYRRALSKYAIGDKSGAIDDYTHAIAAYPRNSSAYANRGNTRGELGDREGAVSDCGKAVKLNPKNIFAYTCRGIAIAGRRTNKAYREAIKDFDAALKIDPNYAVAYLNRARVRRALKEYSAALADYDQVMLLSSSEAVSKERLEILVLLDLQQTNAP